jgi:hypothetical protein
LHSRESALGHWSSEAFQRLGVVQTVLDIVIDRVFGQLLEFTRCATDPVAVGAVGKCDFGAAAAREYR